VTDVDRGGREEDWWSLTDANTSGLLQRVARCALEWVVVNQKKVTAVNMSVHHPFFFVPLSLGMFCADSYAAGYIGMVRRWVLYAGYQDLLFLVYVESELDVVFECVPPVVRSERAFFVQLHDLWRGDGPVVVLELREEATERL